MCVSAEDPWQTAKHESGTCALYGTAGHRADGDALDKPQNSHAQHVSKDSYATLQAACPQLVAEYGGENGTYCCDSRQIGDLSTKVRCLSELAGSAPNRQRPLTTDDAVPCGCRYSKD